MKARPVATEDSSCSRTKSVLAKVQKRASNREAPCRLQMPKTKDDAQTVEGEHEQVEMKAYLNKLQEMVPFTPKNRTLSNLEVITSAIFYIRDLRETLGFSSSEFPAGSDNVELDFDIESSQQTQQDSDMGELRSSPLLSSSSVPQRISTITDSSTSSTEKFIPLSQAVSHSPSPVTLDSSPFSEQGHQHIKRQPLCAISSPSNASIPGHRISQKS